MTRGGTLYHLLTLTSYHHADVEQLGGNTILTNTSIEKIANEAIKSLANRHPLLDPAINDTDKYMTYDGSISGFKKSGRDYCKADWDFTVPIQVKGHVDKKNERKKSYITKSVELADLHIYYSERGVLFFEVLMDENGNDETIYYAQLTQSKAKGYLESASKKKRKVSIGVYFIKLPQTPNDLYRILKQFSIDSGKQNKQLADDTIKLKDIPSLQSLTATVVEARSEIDILRKIVSGEVSLFGLIQGNPYEVPVEWKKGEKLTILNTSHKTITIGNTLYYDEYRAKETSDGEIFIFPSDNLEIDLSNSKYHFNYRTDLKKMYTDAKFLLALLVNTEFTIAGYRIEYTDPKMPEDFKERLETIVDLYEALESIGFETSIKLQELDEKSLKDLTFLVNIKLGKYNDKLLSDINRFIWHFQGKNVPILIIRPKDATLKNKFADALYSRKYQTFASIEGRDDEVYITPTFIYYDAETLANLYRYDYGFFYTQIDRADINEYTIDALNMEALKLIKVYDLTGDEQFLHIAEYFEKKLENVQHQEHFVMNILQIKKRLGIWGDTECAELEMIRGDSPEALFGKYVLSEDVNKADYYYKQMSLEDQERNKMYPIYTLYRQIKA